MFITSHHKRKKCMGRLSHWRFPWLDLAVTITITSNSWFRQFANTSHHLCVHILIIFTISLCFLKQNNDVQSNPHSYEEFFPIELVPHSINAKMQVICCIICQLCFSERNAHPTRSSSSSFSSSLWFESLSFCIWNKRKYLIITY